jgi:hypothetical protein
MIGLGTTTPLDFMHVRFTSTNGQFTGYAVQNLGNTSASYSGMLFFDQNGSLGQFQGFNNVTHEYRINNIASNGSINFMLGSNSKFQVRSDGDLDIPGSILKGGIYFLHNLGTNNTAVGIGALQPNFSGSDNTALGYHAVLGITTGSQNTASGSNALHSNSSGSENTAIGYNALYFNTAGLGNTAIGLAALYNNTAGGGNIAIGTNAGFDNTGGSQNIDIGNSGAASDNGIIRIGDPDFHQAFLAAGIWNKQTNPGPVQVVIDQDGRMGTISSSRRYKEEIEDMGGASDGLLSLRPVKFRYRKPYADGSKPIDYGLIAEEVAEIYPDLVVRNKDGQIETVQYQKLTPMMLNELQKQRRELQGQREHAQQQDETIRLLEDRLAEIEALLSGGKVSNAAIAAR